MNHLIEFSFLNLRINLYISLFKIEQSLLGPQSKYKGIVQVLVLTVSSCVIREPIRRMFCSHNQETSRTTYLHQRTNTVQRANGTFKSETISIAESSPLLSETLSVHYSITRGFQPGNLLDPHSIRNNQRSQRQWLTSQTRSWVRAREKTKRRE
jgi:hypothetical protein